jgi:hypothetical protein
MDADWMDRDCTNYFHWCDLTQTNKSYMAISSLTFSGFSVKFLFQPIYIDFALF